MRVSFVEPHLRLFGGIRRILELSNRLCARGVAVTIYHPTGEPCTWMQCRANVRRSEDLRRERHDVVIYNDPNPQDWSLVRRARARLKVFYVLELYETSLLTGLPPTLYLPRNQRTRYMRKSLRSRYLKLVNATWLREWLAEHMGLESILLLGGVNTEMFHPVDRAPGFSSFRVLCSGDPRPRKGTAKIRQAVEIARRQAPEIELREYHGAGIAQDRMAETYGSADLFVENSAQAGWNNPVAEAMACGVPVVCSDIGGVRDFAFHERTALLVPPGNVRALAAAILRLHDNRELGRSLSDAALRYIRTFDWNESAERLQHILEEQLREIDHAGA